MPPILALAAEVLAAACYGFALAMFLGVLDRG